MNTIQDRVLKNIEWQLNKPTGSVKRTDRLVEDLGCDSLDLIEMIMYMEAEFGIDIDETKFDHENFNVDQGIAAITKLIGAEGEAQQAS